LDRWIKRRVRGDALRPVIVPTLKDDSLESLDVVLGFVEISVSHRVGKRRQVVGQLPAEVDLDPAAFNFCPSSLQYGKVS
jgi:hypothetical protein